jgi:hypothetical protein
MICHKDTAIFYKVAPDTYGNDKIVLESSPVLCTFVQQVGFSHSSFSDSVDSDSIMFVDVENSFVQDESYRLEGMYVLITMFGSPQSESWYKVIATAINRDHLLCNRIDTVEIALKKTRPLEIGAS